MYIVYFQVTFWLMVCTGGVAVLTVLLGYVAIAMENRCLLALVSIIIILFITHYDLFPL